MVLMKKGNVSKYVPDIFISAFRKDGFLPFGEEGEVNDALPSSISEEATSAGFVCPHCGKTYAKEATLKRHIKEKH